MEDLSTDFQTVPLRITGSGRPAIPIPLSMTLAGLRERVGRGDEVTQAEVTQVAMTWLDERQRICPGEPDEELELLDAAGQSSGLTAPRWLCHAGGLRHRCVHALLWWRSPRLGQVLLLQLRSWDRATSPGAVDISVGGHVSAGQTVLAVVYREMAEELGLGRSQLATGSLNHCGTYEQCETREGRCDVELREVYCSEITVEGLKATSFQDGEVAGLLMFPATQALALLEQRITPIASGLEFSLPYCLEGGDL